MSLGSVLHFLFSNFGPLIAYYSLKSMFDIQVALIGSLAFVVFEIFQTWKKGKAPSRIFILSSTVSLVFAVSDLYLKSNFLMRYESVASNIITGFFFFSTLWGERTMIQEYIQQKDPTRELTWKLVWRTRVLTLVWTAYFFVKAATYYWVANHYSEAQALAFRTGAGTISFYVMLYLSITQSRKVFDYLEMRGILITPVASKENESAVLV